MLERHIAGDPSSALSTCLGASRAAPADRSGMSATGVQSSSWSSPLRTSRMRVLVVEPDDASRRLLVAAIRSDPSFELSGTATDVASAVYAAAQRAPDLAVVACTLPAGGSIETTMRLSGPPAGVGCIAVGEDQDAVELAAMFAAGALGFVPKGARATRVVDALRMAAHGDLRLPRELSRRLFAGLLEGLHDRPRSVTTPDGRAARIRRIIEERRFEMVFQPIIDLGEGSLVGAEALARFTTEESRSPDLWLQDAEAVGLRVDLELALLSAAVEHCPRLEEGAFMAVNLSPEAVECGQLGDVIPRELMGRIVLEIIDHRSVRDYGALGNALTRLRGDGLRLAVDDSGHGLSSLQQVIRLAPDFIKLNRTLTRDVDSDATRRALVFALATIAAEGGAQVIAEGIESAAELKALLGLGIRYGQGYLIGRPQRPAADGRMVAERVCEPVPIPPTPAPRIALPAARVRTVREACRAAFELLAPELPGKRLLVCQLDNGAGRWRVIAAHGMPETVPTGTNLALEQSLCHHMATGAGPRRCDDVALEPAYDGLEGARLLDAISYAGVPLALEDGCALGALAAVSSARGEFTERDLDTLAAMAGIIVHGLRNDLAGAPDRSPAQHLRHVASTDELTGALNYPSFIREVKDAAAHASDGATFVLDAQVPDLHGLIAQSGRAVADLVVKTMTRELLEIAEPVDLVGRTDEGAVTAVLLQRRPAQQADLTCAIYRERLSESLSRQDLPADVAVRLRPWSDTLAGGLLTPPLP
jgi:EAL domain-containing protein (putative c-di-GMP-specific phosphodiesterase class I)/DNA-binding NarL/FixJ family response regulator/GGDEF domain-containing protein